MGRRPKAGSSHVNVTVKVLRESYLELQLIAIGKGISHVALIELILEMYVKDRVGARGDKAI